VERATAVAAAKAACVPARPARAAAVRPTAVTEAGAAAANRRTSRLRASRCFAGRAASAARPVFLAHRLACYHPNHDVAPLSCLSGLNPRDSRQTDLPGMRHDPRNLLRGRAHGAGHFLPAAACITGTIGAT